MLLFNISIVKIIDTYVVYIQHWRETGVQNVDIWASIISASVLMGGWFMCMFVSDQQGCLSFFRNEFSFP